MLSEISKNSWCCGRGVGVLPYTWSGSGPVWGLGGCTLFFGWSFALPFLVLPNCKGDTIYSPYFCFTNNSRNAVCRIECIAYIYFYYTIWFVQMQALNNKHSKMSYEFRKKSELLRKKCNIRQIRIRFGNVYR